MMAPHVRTSVHHLGVSWRPQSVSSLTLSPSQCTRGDHSPDGASSSSFFVASASFASSSSFVSFSCSFSAFSPSTSVPVGAPNVRFMKLRGASVQGRRNSRRSVYQSTQDEGPWTREQRWRPCSVRQRGGMGGSALDRVRRLLGLLVQRDQDCKHVGGRARARTHTNPHIAHAESERFARARAPMRPHAHARAHTHTRGHTQKEHIKKKMPLLLQSIVCFVF